MKKPLGGLTLRTETVRQLSGAHLKLVAGGVAPVGSCSWPPCKNLSCSTYLPDGDTGCDDTVTTNNCPTNLTC
jgi:hypothetical protein